MKTSEEIRQEYKTKLENVKEKIRETYFTGEDFVQVEENFRKLVQEKKEDPAYKKAAAAYLAADEEAHRICAEAGDDVKQMLRDSKEKTRECLQAKLDFMEQYLADVIAENEREMEQELSRLG